MSTAEQSKWPHQTPAALNAFYGNPIGRGAYASPSWEAKNIGYWVPPYPMFYSDAAKTLFRRGLRAHVKCHATLTAAFTEALQTLGHDYIVAHRLDISGGIYCYRTERGGASLSVHSWGCAIDMDPGHNPFPHQWRPGMLDEKFASILEKHGFTWRGRDGDIDPMHLQLAWRP
jgi:D-alanyl-D-alanine carboxypeptidase